jgi:hypothetical protein
MKLRIPIDECLHCVTQTVCVQMACKDKAYMDVATFTHAVVEVCQVRTDERHVGMNELAQVLLGRGRL